MDAEAGVPSRRRPPVPDGSPEAVAEPPCGCPEALSPPAPVEVAAQGAVAVDPALSERVSPDNPAEGERGREHVPVAIERAERPRIRDGDAHVDGVCRSSAAGSRRCRDARGSSLMTISRPPSAVARTGPAVGGPDAAAAGTSVAVLPLGCGRRGGPATRARPRPVEPPHRPRFRSRPGGRAPGRGWWSAARRPGRNRSGPRGCPDGRARPLPKVLRRSTRRSRPPIRPPTRRPGQ